MVFHAALAQVHPDGGGPQQVSGIDEFHPYTLAQVDLFSILTGLQVLRHLLGILNGIQRLYRRASRPRALAVLPLGVLLLNVGRVQQR